MRQNVTEEIGDLGLKTVLCNLAC